MSRGRVASLKMLPKGGRASNRKCYPSQRPRQSRGLEFVNRSKRLSRLKAAESIAYLKVFSAIPAACPQLPFFTYISPCLRALILPLTFVGCIYSSFSLSFGIHTEVFYIVVNVKHWESPSKAGGLPFKSINLQKKLLAMFIVGKGMPLVKGGWMVQVFLS